MWTMFLNILLGVISFVGSWFIFFIVTYKMITISTTIKDNNERKLPYLCACSHVLGFIMALILYVIPSVLVFIRGVLSEASQKVFSRLEWPRILNDLFSIDNFGKE